ncbi:unnamed protein product [Closterium sp. NIES-65]|nr:unnamed protein product [Closterium sp. NIES-65]
MRHPASHASHSHGPIRIDQHTQHTAARRSDPLSSSSLYHTPTRPAVESTHKSHNISCATFALPHQDRPAHSAQSSSQRPALFLQPLPHADQTGQEMSERLFVDVRPSPCQSCQQRGVFLQGRVLLPVQPCGDGTVLFHFWFGHGSQRKSQAVRRSRCPICRTACGTTKGLRNHLEASHSRFDYTFHLQQPLPVVHVTCKPQLVTTCAGLSCGACVGGEKDGGAAAGDVCVAAAGAAAAAAAEGAGAAAAAEGAGAAAAGGAKGKERVDFGGGGVLKEKGTEEEGAKEEERGERKGKREEKEKKKGKEKAEGKVEAVEEKKRVEMSLEVAQRIAEEMRAEAKASRDRGRRFERAEEEAREEVCRKWSSGLLQRTFYHSQRWQPITAQEMVQDSDSEDEWDEAAASYADRKLLGEFEDVLGEEKGIMHRWMAFVRRHRVIADRHVPWACEAFAITHKDFLSSSPCTRM